MARQFDYREIDSIIHAPVRLGIVSMLASVGELDFNSIGEQLELSDGNLSTHLRKLEESGYVECRKSFLDRKPRSTYRLLPKGRAAFERYINVLEKIALSDRKRR